MILIFNNCKLTSLFSNCSEADILCFYRNKNFTDISLTNFGKSLE